MANGLITISGEGRNSTAVGLDLPEDTTFERREARQ